MELNPGGKQLSSMNPIEECKKMRHTSQGNPEYAEFILPSPTEPKSENRLTKLLPHQVLFQRLLSSQNKEILNMQNLFWLPRPNLNQKTD